MQNIKRVLDDIRAAERAGYMAALGEPGGCMCAQFVKKSSRRHRLDIELTAMYSRENGTAGQPIKRRCEVQSNGWVTAMIVSREIDVYHSNMKQHTSLLLSVARETVEEGA